MNNAVTRKRRFLIDFTYPNGQEMCALLGLTPADIDVAELEQKASWNHNYALFHTKIEALVQEMATWAVDAASVGVNPPELHKEVLRAILIEFHRASLASLIHERLIEIPGLGVDDV